MWGDRKNQKKSSVVAWVLVFVRNPPSQYCLVVVVVVVVGMYI